MSNLAAHYIGMVMDTRFTSRQLDLIAMLVRAELASLENVHDPVEWIIVRMRELRTILNKINY